MIVRLRTMLRDKSGRANMTVSALGLAVAIACCTLIFLYARSELAVNDIFSKTDRIYRLDSQWREPTMGLPMTTLAAAGPTMVQEFPEAVNQVRIYLMTNTVRVNLSGRSGAVEDDDGDEIPAILNQVQDDVSGTAESYRIEVMMADSTLMRMFNLPFLHGVRETALDQPHSVVISKEFAETAFGSSGPDILGRTLAIETWAAGWQDYTVTGVLDRMPYNNVTHFLEDNHQLIIPPTPFGEFFDESGWNGWYSRYILQYIELASGTSEQTLQTKLGDFVEDYAPADFHDNLHIRLNPLKTLYLTDFENRGWRVVRMLGMVGLLILLIACINFTNLATAQSFSRVGEVGVRKALGAGRLRLAVEFLSQSMLITFIATLAGLALAAILVDPFFDLLGKEVALETPFDGVTIAAVLGLAVATGILAGAYPALVLSSFRPSRALRGQEAFRPSVLWLRRGLVVLQFTAAIVLLISVYTISRQLSFVTEMDLGFDRDNVLVIQSMPRQFDAAGLSRAQTARAHILDAVPEVRSVSLSWGAANDGAGNTRTLVPAGRNRDAALSVAYHVVDRSFFETYGIDLITGRLFEENRMTDSGDDGNPHGQGDPEGLAGIILNSKAAEAFGWQPSEAVGQRIQIGFAQEGSPDGVEPESPPSQEVIGVVEDIHFESLHEPIRPLAYFSVEDESMYRILSVRLASNASSDFAKTVEAVKTVWTEVFPTAPFDYYFLDDNLDRVYQTERKVRRIAGVAAALALFIACLGMLGLASLSVSQRTKEIGVRKVLGASVQNIVGLLSRDIVKLVIAALVIAAPISFLIVNRWLEAFAYRIATPWQAFFIAGIVAVGLAWVTVSYHAIRAAAADPVESLRYE